MRSPWTNCVFLFLILLLGSQALAYQPAENPRLTLNFDADWKFIRENPPGAEQTSFDDSKWQTVGLPHTYNDQDTYNKPPDPKNGDGGWGGKTWYRKHFTLDPHDQGRQIYLEIEAARTVANVYLNGHHLGEYRSGFSSFAFDLTGLISFDKPNVLAIQVDDTEGEDIAAGNLSHWQPVLGGLYRNVRLHVLDKLHVTLPFYSFLKTEGTYVGTPKVTALAADFRMTTEVRNAYDHAATCKLKTEIVDAAGNVALVLNDEHEVPAGQVFKFDQSGIIKKPHLWSVATPYLYTVYSTLSTGGKVTDVYTTPLGVRTIAFDNAKQRFMLNGEELILKGWGQKPENSWPGLGSALPDWLLVNDMQMMKDTGGNLVRWGHCAGPVPELDCGDRIGYLNWQPNISGESDYKGAVWDNKMAVLRDVLIRDRNHPSIVIWEGNNRDISPEHTEQMKKIVQQWDWIIPRPYATRGPYKPETEKFQDFSIDMNGHHFIKDLAGVEGEWYRPEAPRRAWDKDSYPFVDYPGAGQKDDYWRTQQDAMREFVRGWRNIASRGGGVKWHFTDDTTHHRLGDYAMARLSGTVDATRLPKDMNLAMACVYRDDPQVHIMGHWNYTKTHTIDVYSNCDEVELLVNDHSLGTKPIADWHATWENIPFTAGTLRAVGKNSGSPDCFDEHKTAGEPARIQLELLTNPIGLRADRADVALITATIVDKDGIPHPTAHDRITFSVEGPAVYKGGYNDNIKDTVGKPSLLAEAGKIRIALRSTDQPGKIVVKASADGLEPGTITFVSHAITDPPIKASNETTPR